MGHLGRVGFQNLYQITLVNYLKSSKIWSCPGGGRVLYEGCIWLEQGPACWRQQVWHLFTWHEQEYSINQEIVSSWIARTAKKNSPRRGVTRRGADWPHKGGDAFHSTVSPPAPLAVCPEVVLTRSGLVVAWLINGGEHCLTGSLILHFIPTNEQSSSILEWWWGKECGSGSRRSKLEFSLVESSLVESSLFAEFGLDLKIGHP